MHFTPTFSFGKNFILALIPLIISVLIFSFRNFTHKNILWWPLFFVFLIFLPNAPYVLTDYFHLLSAFNFYTNKFFVLFVLVPAYVIYILLCLELFTLSLLMLCRYLIRNNYKTHILPVERISLLLCSFGIYFGRFQRLNSWEIITKTNQLLKEIFSNTTNIVFWVYIILIYWALSALYYKFKYLNIHLMTRIIRYQKKENIIRKRL